MYVRMNEMSSRCSKVVPGPVQLSCGTTFVIINKWLLLLFYLTMHISINHFYFFTPVLLSISVLVPLVSWFCVCIAFSGQLFMLQRVATPSYCRITVAGVAEHINLLQGFFHLQFLQHKRSKRACARSADGEAVYRLMHHVRLAFLREFVYIQVCLRTSQSLVAICESIISNTSLVI